MNKLGIKHGEDNFIETNNDDDDVDDDAMRRNTQTMMKKTAINNEISQNDLI